MIKFFRKIRYNLMETGKTSKYFKYAIGEIILVVIGILIALQINNWNEANKMSINEQQLTSSVIKELEGQRTILNRNLDVNQLILKESASYLDDTYPEEKKDSSIIVALISHNNTHLKIPLVESILNNTESNYLSDKNLLKELRNLNTLNENLLSNEGFLDNFWNTKTAEFLIRKKYAHSTLDIFSRKGVIKSKAYRKLYNDAEFRDLIALKYVLHNSWVLNQLSVLEKLDEILLYLKNDQTND